MGSAVIEWVTPYGPADGLAYERLCRWHLADVERADRLQKPEGHPQPVWFRAF